MITARFLIALIVCGLPIGVFADSMWSSGPADGFTGAPGEGTCNLCHEFGPSDGSVEIEGLPPVYVTAQTYTVTVRLQDPGQQRWGFELTAIDENGDGAGTFMITDPLNTQLSDNNPETARDYVKHTSQGIYNGTLDGPVTWEFQWIAPASDRGPVSIYAAGNAADGDGTTAGNYIYMTMKNVDSDLNGVPSVSITGLIILTVALLATALVLVRRRVKTPVPQTR
jgi:hypothetical protein